MSTIKHSQTTRYWYTQGKLTEFRIRKTQRGHFGKHKNHRFGTLYHAQNALKCNFNQNQKYDRNHHSRLILLFIRSIIVEELTNSRNMWMSRLKTNRHSMRYTIKCNFEIKSSPLDYLYQFLFSQKFRLCWI